MPAHSDTRARFGAAALLCVAVCGIVSVCSGRAYADQARVRLHYERAEGAEACVDEAALRDAVSARLGYDPFVAGEPADIVEVRVTPRGQGFERRIVRRAAEQTAPSKPSRIRSRGSDCRELADALALAVSVAVDPLSLTRAELAAQPLPPAAEPEADEAPPALDEPPAPVEQDEDALPPDLDARARLSAADGDRAVTRLHVGLGATLGGWVLPRVSFGGQLLVGLSHEWFELDVDARYEASGRHRMKAGALEASLLAASIAPCARYGWVLACAVATLGSLRGELSAASKAEERDLYAALGVRSALDIPLWRVLSLRLHGAFQVRLVDTELFAWQPRTSGFAGGALFMVRVP